MKVLQYLVPVLVAVFSKKSALAMKEELRSEVLSLALKIVIGLIFAAMIVFSLTLVGLQINAILVSLEQGRVLAIIFFATLALVCSIALYYIFAGNGSKAQARHCEAPEAGSQLNFEAVLCSFLNGLNEGLNKSSQSTDKKE